jgi:hypothetical protein
MCVPFAYLFLAQLTRRVVDLENAVELLDVARLEVSQPVSQSSARSRTVFSLASLSLSPALVCLVWQAVEKTDAGRMLVRMTRQLVGLTVVKDKVSLSRSSACAHALHCSLSVVWFPAQRVCAPPRG